VNPGPPPGLQLRGKRGIINAESLEEAPPVPAAPTHAQQKAGQHEQKDNREQAIVKHPNHDR